MANDESTSEVEPPVSEDSSQSSELGQLVDHFFRHEYARLVATLTRRFGVRHWELVEDVVQSALQRALGTWPRQGMPDNPTAWLHRVAANLAVDALRRDSRWELLDETLRTELCVGFAPTAADHGDVGDDMLRMMFVCCDPGVPAESQIALALKTLCGFGNREIARALLTTEASVAKRITRAKQRLRDNGVEPSDMSGKELRERMKYVESVIYLLFNEGYSSTVADKPIREDLCEEAVRLALLLAEHSQTRGGESAALLALLLFHAARLDTRIDENGAILLLKEQDRSRWDRRLLREAYHWLGAATSGREVTRYHAEALIAAEHCRAKSIDDTNWERIVQAYDLLCSLAPSPVHELNRAIALGRRFGADAGLQALLAIESSRLEKDYYLWHATRADLARQMSDWDTARHSLQQAWELAPTNAEKELICRKIDSLRETSI